MESVLVGAAPRRAPVDRFRPDIEGLRAVAVLLVLLYHAGFTAFSGGFIGVDVFFVLSGFLITSLLLRELSGTGTISLANFWARRARRLLPASGLVLVATLIGGRLVLDGLSQADLARDAIAASAFVVNIRFAQVGTDYLASQLPPSPLLHFWSLSVEEQFYLLWPGLLLVLTRVLGFSRRALGATIGALWLVSFVWCVSLTTRSQPSAFFLLHTRAWELLTGAALAFVGGSFASLARRPRALVGWAGLATIVACGIVFDDTMTFPGWIAAVPVLATVAVVSTGGGPAAGPVRVLSAPWMQWVGARSYAIYLWHFPMLVLADREWGPLSAPERLSILVLSVLVAAVSYDFVENPVRHSRSLAAVPARSLAMGGAIVLLGVGTGALVLHHPPKLDAGVAAAAPTLVGSVATQPTAAAGPTPSASTSTPEVASAAPPVASTVDATSTTMRVPPADASQDDPPALAAMVAANLPMLEAGERTTEVPSNLSPSLLQARDDLPDVYRNGCILERGDTTPEPCIYGDPNGSVTVVLFGDSHAAQWMPAMHLVAAQHGWRLLVYTKKACPTAEIPTEKDPGGTDCPPWRAEVLAQIARIHPDLVVLSAYRYKAAGAAIGRNPDQVWKEGLGTTVSLLRPNTEHLLLLGDSATPLDDVPSCLAANVTFVPACMNTREGAVRPGRLGVEREVAAAHDADFIPTSNWMCTATACPVVVGNVLMYRDNSHLTETASRFLAPYVDAALRSVLEE